MPDRSAPRADAASLAFQLARDPDSWRPLVCRMCEGRSYAAVPGLDDAEAWVITWAPGSGLDLHDHGGAPGALAVVDGSLTERYGRRPAPGVLRTRVLDDGALVAFGVDHLHELRNLGVTPAVSIHVYAPGLELMHFYDDPGDSGSVRWRRAERRESALVAAGARP